MRNLTLSILALAFSGGCVAGEVRDEFIRTPEGATLSAFYALPDASGPAPAILVFDIYARPEEYLQQVREFAARGYAGIIASARGKRASPDAPCPYECEARDVHAVIEWIARQPWSNGKVGMIGSSYSGFTAWAATKYRHRALKGIAVSAAAIPGQGLPMANNVFLSANYAWPFYVTNNPLLDDAVNNDNERWSNMRLNWFRSGRPYRELDAIDGTPNPWFQRWLQHPAFDAYWQSMAPFGKEFARIDIPVLTITGYYDDGQISALQYYHEHVKRRRKAEHYVVIGPYDHFGSHAAQKPAVLRDYPIDPVAQIDSVEMKLAFMDYVLRGKPRPPMLVDRINYQVMGANEWRHAPDVATLRRHSQRLYFTATRGDPHHALTPNAPPEGSFVPLRADLADRVWLHNSHSYPWPIVQQGPLDRVTESMFLSEPFSAATTIGGAFTGELNVTINKKDFDLGITVYEVMPDGQRFHLGYTVQRASYAADPTRRHLLEPGKPSRIRFATSWTGRRLQPGSRLLVLLDTIKMPIYQTNFGTGKDVSDESVADAGTALEIHWNAGSYMDVPVG